MIKNNFLTSSLLAILWVTYSSLLSCAMAEPDLESLTVYSTVYTEGPVKLKDGEYRAPAAPGSASDIIVRLSAKRAFVNIEGLPVGAVIIISSTGGSGTFRELALLVMEDNVWINKDTLLLGDRVKVHSVEIKEDRIYVLMSTHAPGDPLCCPTLVLKKIYQASNGVLIPVTDAEGFDK